MKVPGSAAWELRCQDDTRMQSMKHACTSASHTKKLSGSTTKCVSFAINSNIEKVPKLISSQRQRAASVTAERNISTIKKTSSEEQLWKITDYDPNKSSFIVED